MHEQQQVVMPPETKRLTKDADNSVEEGRMSKCPMLVARRRRSAALPLWSFASVRLSIAIALALSLAIEGLMRSNINMAMVCMVNKTAVALAEAAAMNGTTSYNNLLLTTPAVCAPQHMGKEFEQYNNQNQSAKNEKYFGGGGELVFSKRQQSWIFTSFYMGGLLIILPGSYLCDWLGPSRLVLYGALLNVFGTFVTPFVARNMGAMALTGVRFLMGCGQGILVPCVNVLVAHWFPLAEKSTAIAISTTGNQVSVILAMFLTAELCVLHWLGGWASNFYIYGIIGVVFCGVWMALVTDFPAQCSRIQPDELAHIQRHGGHHYCPPATTDQNSGSAKMVHSKEVPWRRILTSMVVWSTGLSSFSQNFMNVGIVVYLPTYYQHVLGMDLTSNGLMSALPFVVQLFTKILFAGIADWAKSRRLLSPTAVTKLFNLVASLGAGFCFVLLSFCDCHRPYLAIALAVSAVGISSGFIPGYNTSVVCIAPRFTSSVASFSRLLGQIASVASPYGIGLIVARGTKAEWQIAFWTMAAILVVTGLLFQLFGSASVQEWATVTSAPPAPQTNSDDGTRAETHLRQHSVLALKLSEVAELEEEEGGGGQDGTETAEDGRAEEGKKEGKDKVGGG